MGVLELPFVSQSVGLSHFVINVETVTFKINLVLLKIKFNVIVPLECWVKSGDWGALQG